MESKEINTSAETLVESADSPEAVQTAAPEAPEESAAETETVPPAEELSAEQILSFTDEPRADQSEAHIRAMVEAAIYITEEPLTVQLMAAALEQPEEKIRQYLDELAAEYEKPGHGLTIKEVAGGYKMATKPEHHEAIRSFVRKLKPPLKLSLAALETLSVIAYKQPITAPEIMEIRGVQGAGVLKTLIDRKLITPAGRKQVVGKPILYKTTRDFLVQFGLKDLSELPTLKEFEELRRLAIDPEPSPEPAVETAPAPPVEPPAAAEAPQAEEPGSPEPAPAAESATGN
jgi:segregation and condensation protein B